MPAVSNPIDDPRFELVPPGRFRDRFGPLGRDAVFSSKKLCIVATDPARLVDILYGISLRRDCFYVKYGTIAREGMYLARVFLATDHAVSELCHELKGHPSLMVSLQDDAWFENFRDEPVSDESCGVWDDWPEHESQIAALLESVFARPNEARMVATLRAERGAAISLMAQVSPKERRRESWPIVGYVSLSAVTIDGNAEPRGLALAPLAVAADHRRRGFGARLVGAALRRARLLGYAYVVAPKSPTFFSRFGFAPATQLGLSHPDSALHSHCTVLELVSNSLAHEKGVINYHPALYPEARGSL